MILYYISLLLILFSVSHFLNEKNYYFTFVILTLLTPFSVLITDLGPGLFLNTLWIDKVLVSGLCFLLGAYKLYLLIDSESVGMRDEKYVLLCFFPLLINSINFKIALVIVLGVFLWIEIGEKKTYTNLKLLLSVLLLFVVKFKEISWGLEISISIAFVLCVFQFFENLKLQELLVLLIMASIISSRFNSDVVGYMILPILVFLALPYFLDSARWSTIVGFFNRSKFVNKCLIKMSWNNGFALKNPFDLIIVKRGVMQKTMKKNYLEHKNDVLLGMVTVLMLTILGFALV